MFINEKNYVYYTLGVENLGAFPRFLCEFLLLTGVLATSSSFLTLK